MTFDIGELHPNSPHLFADLAELLLLVNHNGRKFLHLNDLESLLNAGSISADEIDEDEEADQSEKSSADQNSRRDRQLEDVFTQLVYRSAALAGFYPFTVDRDRIELIEPLSDDQRIYRLLVACSRLRSFGKKGLAQGWARHFSELSSAALKGLVPAHAQTRIFDAHSQDRKTYYGNKLSDALIKLGDDLGVLSVNHDECAKAGTSTGDGGFDLVAWIDFADGGATNYAVLGQCGAQETGWPKKTLEAHSLHARNYFQMQFDYPGVMFTPVCYRNSDGAWASNKTTNGILLADRIRILNLVKSDSSIKKIVNCAWFASFESEFSEFKSDP